MIKTTRGKRESKVADARETPTIEVRIGPDPRGPAVCLHCRQPFKKGETWRRMTSPPDPKFGVYSFGIHDRCTDAIDAKAA